MDIEIKEPDFVWNVGKIDKLIQKERYAPVYRKDVGVVGGKFVNKQEFEAAWDAEFKNALKKV